MSTTIDQKVLEMRFDNKQFEDGVQESISTLDKLKQAMNFDGVEKNFDALSDASKSVDFSPLHTGLENLGNKFKHIFEEIGIGALRNFGASLEQNVISKINEMTFGQFTEGWGKYEDKTQSVQTIMAATGKTIEEVNEQLMRMNWYSDETSYSFTDMTSNVGKFTSAGVELEDAVSAMQGIASWSALAGQNAQTASRAMYNLSQAMGIGYVGLADWKSIELAGMATMDFKEVVLDVAASMGVLRKYEDGTYQFLNEEGKAFDVTAEGMRDTLREKWFNKDVLMNVLGIYGDFSNELAKVVEEVDIRTADFMEALDVYDGSVESISDICKKAGVSAEELIPHLDRLGSSTYELGRKAFRAAQESKSLTDSLEATKDAISTGWMTTFELLFGNYEQAKGVFTQLTDTLWELFAASGDVRNDILRDWSELGGGDIFREGLINTLSGISNIAESIGKVFDHITGATRKVFDANTKTFGETTVAVDRLLNITKKFGSWTENFSKITENFLDNAMLFGSDAGYIGFTEAFEGAISVINIVLNLLSSLKPLLSFSFHIIDDILVLLADMISPIGQLVQWLEKIITENNIFSKSAEKIASVLTVVANVFENAVFAIERFIFRIIDGAKEAQIFSNIFEGIKILIDPIIQKFKTFFSLFDNIKLPNFTEVLGLNKAWNLQPFIDFSQKIIPFFEKLRDDMRETFAPVLEVLSKIAGTAEKVLVIILGGSLITLAATFMSIVAVVTIVIQKVKEFIDLLHGKISLDQFLSFNEVLEKIKAKLDPIYEKLKNIFTEIKNSLTSTDWGKTILPYLEKLEAVLTPVVNKLKEFFGISKEKIDTTQFTGFHDILEKIKNVLEPVWNFIKDIFNSLKEFDFTSAFEKISEFVVKIASTIWDALSNLDFKKIGDNILKVFQNVAEKIGNVFKNINFGETLQNAGAKISGVFGDFSFSNIFEYLTKSVALFGGFNLGKLFGSVSDVLSGGGSEGGFFGGLTDKLSGLFSGLQDSIGNFTEKTDESKLGSIAKGIGIFAVALLVLGSVDSNKVTDVLLAVGAAFGGTFVVSKGLSLLDDAAIKNIQRAGFGLLEVAAAVLILVKALQPLADMNSEQLAKMGGALTAIFGEIIIFTSVFASANEKHDAKNAQKAATAFVEISVAVKIIVDAMKNISKLNGADYMQAIVAFTAIMVEVGILEKEMSKQDVSQLNKIGTAAILLGIAMNEFALAFRGLNNNDPGKWLESLIAFRLILLEVGLIESIMSKQNTDGLNKFGTSAVLLGFAMNEFASAFKKFGSSDFGHWLESMMAFRLVLLEIGAFEAILSGMDVGGMIKASAAMVVLAAGMNLLVPALTAFALLPWKAFGYFSALLGVVTAFGAVAGFLTPISVGLFAIGTAILEIGAGVALVGAGVSLLGFGLLEIASAIAMINLAGIIASIAQIGDGLAGLINNLNITLLINNLKLLFAALPEMITTLLVGVINGLSSIIDSVKDLILTFIDSLVELTPALFDGLLIMFVEALSSLSENMAQIIPLLMDILSQILDALVEYTPPLVEKLAALFCKLFDSLTEHVPEMVTSFMRFLGALFGEILKAVDAASPDAILKMIEMIGFLDALIISCVALGPLIIPAGMAGLAALGVFVAELSAILVALGALNSIPGFQELVGRGGNLLQGIGTAIGQFIGGIVGGIAEGVTSVLPIIGNQLSQFWTNASSFFNGVKSIGKETVSSVDSLAKAVLTLTAAGILDGITKWITGGTNIKSFGKSISELGPYLKVFADSVRGIDTQTVKIASEAIATIAGTFDTNAFKTGGVVQWFKGEMTDIDNFGKGLVKLGPYIMAYAKSVTGLPVDVIENSTRGANAISEMANNLPKTGGFVQWLSGEQSLVDFAASLALLGPNLMIYAKSVSGLDPKIVENSLNAAKSISNFAENLPQKSTVDLIFGRDTIRELSENLITLGGAIKTYYDSISGINTQKLKDVLQSVGDIFTFFDGKDSKSFKIDTSFTKAMKEAGERGVKSFVDSITNAMTDIQNKGAEMITSFNLGIESVSKDTIALINKMLSNILTKISREAGTFKRYGANLISEFSNGIAGTMSIVESSVNVIIQKLKDHFGSLELQNWFRLAARDMMLFFSAGMLESVEAVSLSITSLVQVALGELNSSELMSSFAVAGSSVGNSFAMGLQSQADNVLAAASSLSGSAQTAVNQGLSDLEWRVQQLLNDVNYTPTITPVLDMSEAERDLQDMLDRYRELDISLDDLQDRLPSNNYPETVYYDSRYGQSSSPWDHYQGSITVNQNIANGDPNTITNATLAALNRAMNNGTVISPY